MKDRGALPTSSDLERYRIESLSKGLRLLRLFGQAQRPLSLSEIADQLGWNKVSAYRFLATLQSNGYVDQDPISKFYVLTSQVMELGFSYLNGLNFPERALPYLHRLSQETGQACNMSVLDGNEIVYVARVASRSILSINLHVGSRLPAYCTSMGKVLLAWRPHHELQTAVRRMKLEPRTPKTVRTHQDLLKTLAAVRERGFAVNDQELEIGLRSAAMPCSMRSLTLSLRSTFQCRPRERWPRFFEQRIAFR